MRVCRNSARRVSGSPRPAASLSRTSASVVGVGRSKGLSRPFGRAELQVQAADGVGEAVVFVFRVDDQHVDPAVQRAERFEFGEVTFAGSGTGQDDGVVVVLGEPVPQQQPAAGGGRPVEHPVGGGGVRVRERIRRRQRRRVERSGERELVDADREAGDPALQLPERGGLQVQQHPGADPTNPDAFSIQCGGAVGVDGEGEPDAEQPAVAAGQRRRQGCGRLRRPRQRRGWQAGRGTRRRGGSIPAGPTDGAADRPRPGPVSVRYAATHQPGWGWRSAARASRNRPRGDSRRPQTCGSNRRRQSADPCRWSLRRGRAA